MELCLTYLMLALSEKNFCSSFCLIFLNPIHAHTYDITDRNRIYYYHKMCKCVFREMFTLLVIITVQEKITNNNMRLSKLSKRTRLSSNIKNTLPIN